MDEASPSRPVSRFRIERQIEFADTDMGRIVHFARFFVFMETAEHRFFEQLGTAPHMEWEGREVGWPRVEASCEYLRPVRYGDRLEIHLRVARKGRSSLAYSFSFLRDGEEVARGRTASVCCLMDDPAGLRPIPIPPFIADRIEQAPES